MIDVADGGFNEDGLIRDDAHLHVFGQRLLNLFHAGADAGGSGDGVFAGLLGDEQGDRRDTIEACGSAGFFITILGIADVIDADNVGALGGDGDLIEF